MTDLFLSCSAWVLIDISSSGSTQSVWDCPNLSSLVAMFRFFFIILFIFRRFLSAFKRGPNGNKKDNYTSFPSATLRASPFFFNLPPISFSFASAGGIHCWQEERLEVNNSASVISLPIKKKRHQTFSRTHRPSWSQPPPVRLSVPPRSAITMGLLPITYKYF